MSDTPEKTYPVELTRREITLVRVALLQRLDHLKKVIEDVTPADEVERSAYDGCKQSYAGIKELMNGKMWAVWQLADKKSEG
jgi:hypothetical protein